MSWLNSPDVMNRLSMSSWVTSLKTGRPIVTLWLIATLGFLPPLAVSLWHAMRGSLAARLVAVQLATGFTSLIIVLMSFAFD